MVTPSIRLLAYASPATATLDQACQAERLVAALAAFQCDFVELNFAGVDGVSTEFSELFVLLAEEKLAETWLTPHNYEISCNRLVKRLLSRLRRQREQAWAEGCERFSTGRHP